MEQEWILATDADGLLGLKPYHVTTRIKNGTMEGALFAPDNRSKGSPFLRWHVRLADVEAEIAQRELKPVADLDAAYMAGMVDGEGCITVFKKKGSRSPSYNIALCVVSVDECIVIWCKETFGGSLATPRRIREEWQFVHQWMSTTGTAERVLRIIQPYLKIKKRQAELAIEFCEHIRIYGANRYHPLTPEEVDWRERQKELISQANRRYRDGPSRGPKRTTRNYTDIAILA